MGPNQNYFTASSSSNVGYIEIEEGYIYHFYNNLDNYDIYCAYSNEVPALNGTYHDGFKINRLSTYSFVSTNSNYLYFDFQHSNTTVITREKLTNQDGVINDLVNDIGLDSIWGIFDNSINFIYIAIAFAFGFGLITLLIKKISKGSE